MEFLPTELSGVLVVRPRVFTDLRGSFIKTFHAPMFAAAGLGEFVPQEEFYSTSHRNVLRGMHFQTPPHTQTRLVGCLTGSILDVVVDLRKSSPTFGRAICRELTAANREMLFISEGFAHGFLSLEDNSLVSYLAGRPHAPAADTGILWNSFGFAWPVNDPIMSDRDKGFPSFQNFTSPF